MTLYELSKEYMGLLDAIENSDGGDDIDSLIEQLDSVGESWNQKCDNYAKALRNIESDVDALKAEIDRLTKKKKTAEAAAEALKVRMKTAMKSLGLEKAETSIGVWKFGKGRESVQVIDPAQVPLQYKVFPAPTISKTAIMDWYKETGEIVPGAEIIRNESFGLK